MEQTFQVKWIQKLHQLLHFTNLAGSPKAKLDSSDSVINLLQYTKKYSTELNTTLHTTEVEQQLTSEGELTS